MRRHQVGLLVLVAAALASPPVHSQALPLGDGQVSDHAAIGRVFACQTTFRGGGARHDGPWFQGDTWNPSEKPHVSGNVLWPNAALDLSLRGNRVVVTGNGLPVKQPTGSFPITRSDSVYRYDTNPNRIAAQNLHFEIPVAPTSSSPCLPGAETSAHVGWALDGYPILGNRDATGALLTNASLDACHGRAETVTIEGRMYSYACHLTQEYPYTLGCFTGQVPPGTMRDIRAGLLPGRGGPGRRE